MQCRFKCVESLNTLTKIDKIVEKPELINVSEFINTIYHNFLPEADVLGIYLKFSFPLTSAKIMAQREKLIIVMENLIYNAFSFTGDGVEINGNIFSRGDIDILGIVNGNVVPEGSLAVSGTIHVNKDIRVNDSEVKANINGENIIVNANVTGNLTAIQAVNIMQNSTVLGDVVAKRISVQEGAIIEGQFKTTK